jgi:uncharacterized protein (DUF1330 family)
LNVLLRSKTYLFNGLLEGSEALPDAAFIIAFPDRAHAKAFWASAEFQTLAVLRRSGSTLNAILVDGVPDA